MQVSAPVRILVWLGLAWLGVKMAVLLEKVAAQFGAKSRDRRE